MSLGEPRFRWDEIPLAYAMDTSALPLAWDPARRPPTGAPISSGEIFSIGPGAIAPVGRNGAGNAAERCRTMLLNRADEPTLHGA